MTELQPPPEEVVRDRETAFAEVQRRLAPWLVPDGLRVSPLGPGWSSDIDAYVTQEPDPGVLTSAGWVRLDELLAAVGVRERGRWAVVVDGCVMGAADVHVGAPPDPVRHLLERCRREGAGPRQLAELEVLRARGLHVGEVPARRPTAPLRTAVGSVRRAARPRLVVAISGVDGAGKTTLTTRVVDDLAKAGVPATRIWARPGVTHAALDWLSRVGKRLLGEDSTPGLRRAAAGEASEVRSRRGLLGHVWGTLILASFAFEVRRQYARARGVVVFDRHLVDAEVTLHVLYPGRHDLVWRVVRRLIPPADIRFHIDIAPEVAVARKPDDPIGEWAVERQMEDYARVLEDDVTRLDGSEHPDRLALQVLQRVARGRAR